MTSLDSSLTGFTTNHIADDRIVNAEASGDEIQLFYRDLPPLTFRLPGQTFLTDYTIFTDRPSAFRFASDRFAAMVDSALEAEALTHGVNLREFVPDSEGRQHIVRSIQYQRSRRIGVTRSSFTETSASSARLISTLFTGPIMREDSSRFTTLVPYLIWKVSF